MRFETLRGSFVQPLALPLMLSDDWHFLLLYLPLMMTIEAGEIAASLSLQRGTKAIVLIVVFFRLFRGENEHSMSRLGWM